MSPRGGLTLFRVAPSVLSPPKRGGGIVSRENLAGRDLVSLLDFSSAELRRVLQVATEAKSNPRLFEDSLKNKTLFMYFEKPSLRTRVQDGPAFGVDDHPLHVDQCDLRRIRPRARIAHDLGFGEFVLGGHRLHDEPPARTPH